MCYYCHTLQNNPGASMHPGARCLDRSNDYSQVPMNQRIYDCGQPIFIVPSAPPAEEEPIINRSPKRSNLFSRLKKIFIK
ncbi:unnamed protein product [Rotaria sp. Silwood2]|nr:unnamed protein product [Rotaria sp. Silwood2]CAF2759255.1 unnamed protein product [Rotaria sp. Silwood2]CAF2992989.1 unnamed protein product [Rotaria sp. Silwood2]CAF3169533.1 unnamed protein product [Rotaria sp. Silwood2]CAF3967253.1 unnamed protein product [Rotaria sp. Silwood2]